MEMPPEADALEQERPVVADETSDPLTADPEAPEADALEQAQVVPLDEDEDRL